MTKLAREFARRTGVKASVVGIAGGGGADRLADGKLDVLVVSQKPGTSPGKAIARAFGDGSKPVEHPFGLFVVKVMVHPSNSLQSLTLEQLRGLFLGRTNQWSDLGGRRQAVRLVGERRGLKAEEIFRTVALGGKAISRRMDGMESMHDVATAVASDPSAIGFALDDRLEYKAVRFLPIETDETSGKVAPSPAAIHEERYPLCEPLLLYHRPGARDDVKAFCEYACSGLAVETAKSSQLYGDAERQEHEALRRLVSHRAGRGPEIRVICPRLYAGLFRALELEYVRSRRLVQLHVVAADRKAAAEAFKLRRCDVAVFDDLKVDLSVVPAGGRRVILPGRCLAILVHTLNRCRGMTLERLSDVYKGRATDWGEFDGLGDRAGSDTAIRPCGVRSPAGLGLVFHEKVARIAGTRHFQMMEDSSRAMARLSMTPGGIAFVDAAACTDELGKRGLRLLPVGIGENAVLPSPEAVVSGRYPLSTRIALVESPQCSPEARDFLDFVASGGRMRNRFSDTPARVEAAFRAAGGLPPAEPAGEAAAGVQRQGRTTAEEYDR